MDIRRTLLWMIFTFAMLLLWNNWQVYQGQPSLFSMSTPATETVAKQDTKHVPDASTQSTAVSVPIENELAKSEKIHVKTNVYDLEFDTLGAQLVQANLLKYKSLEGDDSPMYLLNDQPDDIYLAQTGVVGAPAGMSYPTHLTQFSLVGEPEVQGDTTKVSFVAESSGVKVVKTYILTEGSYDIKVTNDIYNLTDNVIKPSLYLQLTRDGNDPPNTSGFYSTFTGAAVYSEEDKFQKISFEDIGKNKAKYIKEADNGWIGIVQHYFATAWVPKEGVVRTNEAIKLPDNLYAIRTIEPVGEIAPGANKLVSANLWVGPQDQEAMNAVAPGLELVVDYGWVTIIAKPMFMLLTWIHSLIGNWGWTIIVLTLLIKLVFYPLSAASYRSMAKMKLVAPRMKHLKEQYGDDKAKMNAAMMEMYRTEKINPLGGCLPMIVQIPVFIALYWVLLGSVEMRGAPWVGWITDLSVRDPLFILPIIMMLTMFLQIKLNPTPPDPTQAKIMMIMPLVFGAMMFMFPAGLVLYWCVNNIISLIQQRVIMHKLDREKAAQASS